MRGLGLIGVTALALVPAGAAAHPAQRAAVIEQLDIAYQKAVEQNDTATMARLLADDFILIDGDGKSYTKADLINDAKGGQTRYAVQADTDRKVRFYGNTAVLTAKLIARGLEDGKQVNYTQWFSDVWVMTPHGWRYVFGQTSAVAPTAN